MDNIRIQSQVMTFLRDTREGNPHRELFIDFVQGNTLVARQEFFGYFYVVKNGAVTTQEFSFSPSSLIPYKHDDFKRFVVDVKARRECNFNFEGVGQRTTFTYKNGVLAYENGQLTNGLTLYIKYTEQIGKDLDELAATIHRYMEASREKEILALVQHLETMKT